MNLLLSVTSNPVLKARTGLHGAKRVPGGGLFPHNMQERKQIHKKAESLQVETWAGGALLYVRVGKLGA
jgi:hypothetical protein